MENIIEEAVGEINVDFDFDEYVPRKRHRLEEVDEGAYVMDARVPISETNEILDASFFDRDSRTMGGLITARVRRIPKLGDSIEDAGFRITVEEAGERAVTRLRVESPWSSGQR